MSEALDPRAEAALLRGAFYGSLARAFGPVDAFLMGETPLKELKSLGTDWPELAARLEELPEDVAASKNELASERLRLFEKGECPPYEASYRREVDPLKEALMVDVAGFYRAFGLEPRGELPDHIVSELEFMALLCLKEAHAILKEGDEPLEVVRDAQESFLADHLGRWVARFRDAIHRESTVDLYPKLADLLVDFVQEESRRLDIELEESPPEEGGTDGS